MSAHRIGNWGGYAVGNLVVADEPFEHRMGNCYVEKVDITLPNGVSLKGVKGRPVAEFLGVGTLAVAVEHAGDWYNQYVPLAVVDVQDEQVLRPFIDLEFGAYGFGCTIGRVETGDLRKLAAGFSVVYSGAIALDAALSRL